MTLPWETAPPPVPPPAPVPAPAPAPVPPPPAFAAEVMRPDVEVPVVAVNTVTGQRVPVDIGAPLQAAIEKALTDAVSRHPLLGALGTSTFGDRVLMHGSAIDFVVAVVAALSTFVSPNGWFAAAAWVVAGVMAAKTLIHAAVTRTTGGTA